MPWPLPTPPGCFPEAVLDPPEPRFEFECLECGELYGADDVDEVGESTDAPLREGRRQPGGNFILCWNCLKKQEDEEDEDEE